MTETQAQEPEAAAEVADFCRHCGKPASDEVALDTDWQCPSCERYQDSTLCPTCRQVARISLMRAEDVPAPARRKGKGS